MGREEEAGQEEWWKSTALTLLLAAWRENITLLREEGERQEGGRTKGRLESCY